jgi:hypothetical protein
MLLSTLQLAGQPQSQAVIQNFSSAKVKGLPGASLLTVWAWGAAPVLSGLEFDLQSTPVWEAPVPATGRYRK